MDIEIPKDLEAWRAAGADYLPGHLGIRIETVDPERIVASLAVHQALKAWNGFLHAGSIVALADTCCGYGAVRSLPDGASGFTTVELKSNFLGTAREGTIRCVATPLHKGRSTQVWDAAVTAEGSDKALAHFRCTQMILWPRP